MKTIYVITDGKGKLAGYAMGKGPYLTDNGSLAYSWPNEFEAELQLPLYQAALGNGLTVVQASMVNYRIVLPCAS
jgi:hypothetical protein